IFVGPSVTPPEPVLRKNLRSSECALVAVQVDGVFCRLGVPLLFTEEFELVIMIELRPKRCMGRTEFPDLRGLRREPWLDRPFFPRERNGALLPSACRRVLEKCLTPPTLSERRFSNN